MVDKSYQKLHKNSRGQAFLEFLLLFAMISIISFSILRVVGSRVERRWSAIANKIIGPTPNPDTHPSVNKINLR